MRAVKGKETILAAEDQVGKLQEVANAVKAAGISVRAISAWGAEGKAYFRLVTSDNEKTKEVLQSQGTIQEKEVIIADMPDEVGQLEALASKMTEAGINLSHIYGTTSEPDKPAVIIFASDDNDKALDALSG